MQHELTYHNAGTNTSFTGNGSSSGDTDEESRGAGAGDDGGGNEGNISATDKTGERERKAG